MEGCRRVLGDAHPSTLTSINNLGFLLQAQGALAEAEPYWRTALERRRRVLGEHHAATLQSVANLGFLLNRLGEHAEAAALLAASEPTARRVWADASAGLLGSYLAKLGAAEAGVGRFAEGEATLGEATLGEAHALLAESFGAGAARAIACIRGLISLYEAWHAAEPDAGHEVQSPIGARNSKRGRPRRGRRRRTPAHERRLGNLRAGRGAPGPRRPQPKVNSR